MTTVGEPADPPSRSDPIVDERAHAIGRLPAVGLDEVDKTVPTAGEPSLRLIGFNLAMWLLILIGVVIAGIGVFAWVTYPSPESVAGIVKDNAKAFDDYQQARAAWFTEVKDLVQLLVVSLLVPLLATIIGYIFGRQEHRRVDE
jgi:hypothetical protein